MARFASIGGEKSLVLETNEALALIGKHETQREYDEIYYEIVHGLQDHNIESSNELPVLVHNGFVLPQGGIYSDRELRVAIETGHIICDPAPTQDAGARINGSSIDTTLGHYFYSAGEHGGDGIFNPYDKAETYDYYKIRENDPDGSVLEAKPWADVRRSLGKTAFAHLAEEHEFLRGIPENHPMILLRPGERILAHTNEFIGIIPPGTTSMQARSSFGRIGVSVCYDAGWGDPGFADRWTMEVKNHNEDRCVPLPEGIRAAQIVFMSTGPVGVEYSKASGNYQDSSFQGAHTALKRELGREISLNDFDPTQISASGLHMVSRKYRSILKTNWRPSHMVPKLYTNTLHRAVPVEGLSEGYR